jgi:hypothetical protein
MSKPSVRAQTGLRKIRIGTAAAAAALLPLGLLLPASTAAAATTAGTWGITPRQSYQDSTATTTATGYQTAVRAPINADGSSNFPAKRGVIPVQFDLLSGTNSTTTTTRTYDPPVWQSIGSTPTVASDDFTAGVFTPSTSMTFNDVANLSADYAFTLGDCHGGSLRWTINVTHNGVSQNVHVYYGDPGGNQTCTGAASGSGQNLITTGATNRFEIEGNATPSLYRTYADTQSVVGTDHVNWVGLILDSGWGGDQKADVSNVTVNDNTYVPKTSEVISTVTTPGTFTKTCDLPQAALKWAKNDATPTGAVNEAESIQPKDTGQYYRQVDCKYIYNLDASSLNGTGTYSVWANIGGTNVPQRAVFDLR